MSLTLSLRTENGQLTVAGPDLPDVTTQLDALPARAVALAAPYTHGPALFDALGGETLTQRLDQEADRLLYLDIPANDPADAIPWECAVAPPRIFLVHRYGLLRLVDRDVALDPTPGPLRLVALGADALVDSQGSARDTWRLDILNEMRQIERVLTESDKDVVGERISPTPAALQSALDDGRRTILHLSCHGSLIETCHGPQPVLHLEDDHGGPARLLGDEPDVACFGNVFQAGICPQFQRGTTMTIPENVTLTCTFCDKKWVAPLSDLKAAKEVVYRGQGKSVRRRIDCPNCQRANNVEVPKAWLEDE